MRRLARAHANRVEGLPVFGGLMLIGMLAGKSTLPSCETAVARDAMHEALARIPRCSLLDAWPSATGATNARPTGPQRRHVLNRATP